MIMMIMMVIVKLHSVGVGVDRKYRITRKEICL
jgi:hypothetical protein